MQHTNRKKQQKYKIFPRAETGGNGRTMNILTVSNDAGLLAALSGVLEELFPDAAIARGTDPLMAGKYAFHHEVDILLADVDMKRMDGIQLIHFVRQEQPAVRAYLMGQESALRDLPLNVPEDVAGLIALPLTTAAVAAVLDVSAAKNEEG